MWVPSSLGSFIIFGAIYYIILYFDIIGWLSVDTILHSFWIKFSNNIRYIYILYIMVLGYILLLFILHGSLEKCNYRSYGKDLSTNKNELLKFILVRELIIGGYLCSWTEYNALLILVIYKGNESPKGY